jgi:hypothetical protein
VARGEVVDAPEFAGRLVRNGTLLLDPAQRAEADALNRDLRLAVARQKRETSEPARKEAAAAVAGATRSLATLVEKNPRTIRVRMDADKLVPPAAAPVMLPGDSGALLLRVDAGEGETRWAALEANLSDNTADSEATIWVPVSANGVTCALINLTHVPVRKSSLLIEFISGDRHVRWPMDVQVPAYGRFKAAILSADTGKPAPAMVRLFCKTTGLEREPANAVDFAAQFDRQGRGDHRRKLNLPGYPAEDYCCVPGPIDMELPPGEWEIKIRRGTEHQVLVDTFSVAPGQVVEKTYTPPRWVDMRKLGWYSGDDHVHCRITSDADAQRLMAWVQAEDIRLANIVKMGDINRTWFEQRGWGEAYRVISGDTILSPGQECPRTHNELGHTLAMNTQSMIRDADRYYLYEEVADAVHAQGGLWGYAHVCAKMFHVDRDMSINVPKAKCDFVELLQFQQMGTELYYDFLNLGFKVTASAGSDVPWGGSVGEVRAYAYLGDQQFTADAWFDAVRRGRTFVTNGPMLEFRVDDALPGDEIVCKQDRKLRVKARACVDPGSMMPAKLEIVRHGQVIRSEESSDRTRKELSLDFEIDAGDGFWIAARVQGNDGTAAHTTPIYVVRDGLRFWQFEEVSSQIAKRRKSLDEVEQIVADASRRNQAGELTTDRALQQLALQGAELLRRVAAARAIYDQLEQAATKEKPLRGASK